jgi:hypothetical protein
MVLPDSRRVTRVPRYLGTSPSKSNEFRLQDCHLLWSVFPDRSTIHWVSDLPRDLQFPPVRPHNSKCTTLAGLHAFGLGCSQFARRYFGNHGCFLFLRVLRCFSSPRSPRLPMDSAIDIPELPGMGSPIQRSSAQCLFSGSPKLIAANRVFHHHPAPRHPSSALSSLAIKLSNPHKSAGETVLPVFSFQRASRVFTLELNAQS